MEDSTGPAHPQSPPPKTLAVLLEGSTNRLKALKEAPENPKSFTSEMGVPVRSMLANAQG